MDQIDPTSAGDVERTLDREIELLTSAVRLVAAGGALSTTVAGLHLGEAVLVIVEPLAAAQDVVLEALWGPDEGGFDIRVRRASRLP